MTLIKVSSGSESKQVTATACVPSRCTSLTAVRVADDFDHFHRVNKKLMEKKADSPWFKKVPFQLYVIDDKVRLHRLDSGALTWRTAKNLLLDQVRTDPDVPVTILQQLVELTTEDGIPNTLGQMVDTVLGSGDNRRVVMHGVQPPLETPLQWLCEHFVYPDNFLHIIVSPTGSN